MNTKQITDIPLKNAMLLWNPGSSGEIKVVRHLVEDDSDFRCSTGACWAAWQDGDDDYRRHKLLIEVWHIVVRDGLKPISVHAALQVIPEYREMFDGDEVGWLNEPFVAPGRSMYS